MAFPERAGRPVRQPVPRPGSPPHRLLLGPRSQRTRCQPRALASLVAMATVGSQESRQGQVPGDTPRPGQGRGAGPLAAHCPQSRDSASPGRVGLLGQEEQDFPRDAEKPRPNPHLCLVTRRRGGQLPGRDCGRASPSQTETPRRHWRSASAEQIMCLQKPYTCDQERAPPGSPSHPVQLFSPHNTLCNAPSHLKSLWLAPSQQTLGQGSTRAFKQTGVMEREGMLGKGQRQLSGVESWVPDSAETQAWGTLTLSLPGSPWHVMLGTCGPGKGDCPRPQPTAQLHTGAIRKGSPGHLEGDWQVLASHKMQDTRALRKGANVPGGGGRSPYPEAGASWAHRAPADPPGRAGGRAHRHVHPGGTVPASSGHSPGSQDRQLHLERKQNRVLAGLTQPLPRSGAGLASPPPLQSWPSRAPAIVLGRPFLPHVRDQNQEDKQS